MPREAWFLFAGAFVNRLGTFVLPFIVLYLTRAHFSTPPSRPTTTRARTSRAWSR